MSLAGTIRLLKPSNPDIVSPVKTKAWSCAHLNIRAFNHRQETPFTNRGYRGCYAKCDGGVQIQPYDLKMPAGVVQPGTHPHPHPCLEQCRATYRVAPGRPPIRGMADPKFRNTERNLAAEYSVGLPDGPYQERVYDQICQNFSMQHRKAGSRGTGSKHVARA